MVIKKHALNFIGTQTSIPATNADLAVKLTGQSTPLSTGNSDSIPGETETTSQATQTERQPRRTKKSAASIPPTERVCTVAIRLTKDEYLEIRQYSDQVFRESGVIVSMASIGKEALLKHIRKGAR